MKLDALDIFDPRCERCGSRASDHRLTSLPADAENTIRQKRWCQQGDAFVSRHMSEEEIEAWAYFLALRYRSTDS